MRRERPRVTARGGAPRRPRGRRAAAFRIRRWRRLGAAVAASLACWLVLGPYGARSSPHLREVLVTAAERPVGHVLTGSDVTSLRVPADLVPAGAVVDRTAAVGSTLAAPVSVGEVVTTARLRRDGAGLPRGTRGVHVPLSDPAGAAALAAGDHVDVLAVADGTVVVSDVVIIAVDTAAGGPLGAAARGGGVVLAVPTERVGPLTTTALGGEGHGGVHLAARGTP